MNSIKLKIAAGLAATSVVALGTAYFLNKKGQKKEAIQRKESAVDFFEGYTVYISNDLFEGMVTITKGAPKFNIVSFDADKYAEGGTLAATQVLQVYFYAAVTHASSLRAIKPNYTKQEIFDTIIKNDFDVFSIELTK